MAGIGYMGLSSRSQHHEIEPRWSLTGKLETEPWRLTHPFLKYPTRTAPSLWLDRKSGNFWFNSCFQRHLPVTACDILIFVFHFVSIALKKYRWFQMDYIYQTVKGIGIRGLIGFICFLRNMSQKSVMWLLLREGFWLKL